MGAADDKAPPPSTIEFRTLLQAPGAVARYKFSLTITVDGVEKKFNSKDNTADGGFSGTAMAKFIARQLSLQPGWKYEVVDNKLMIEGWKDPKTEKMYPVKDITFESPDIPKEFWPTLTVPRNKG